MSYSLCKIEWVDAASQDAWQPIANAQEEQEYPVTSVGWLLSETKKWYILGTGISGNGMTACTWRIPKGIVTKKTIIKGHDIDG